VAEVLDALTPASAGVVVDATVGLGGHAAAILENFPSMRLVGLDVDPDALDVARARVASFGSRAVLVEASYRDLSATLARMGLAAVDGFLFDLGVSSLQLDTPERGFSFRHDAPLDMRFARRGVTAAEWLAGASEEELVRTLREYGEEPAARRVARAIANARRAAPIRTTGDLRRLVTTATRGRGGRIDPATRTFQAVRIATNRELEGLPIAIDQAVRLLRPAGRLAVIAFHSLEDRLVKTTMRRLAGRCVCPPGTFACQCSPERLLDILTPKPLRPGPAEVDVNPRARSARLRVGERRRG
jgi:16S rRNA (cytosine1402-N4)-methyltransferase